MHESDPLVGIPVKLRTHARSLIRLLSKAPDVLSVNNQMELIVRGLRIPRSNIHDLMSDVFTKTKSRVAAPRPTGFTSFVSSLRDLNIPRSLIQNPKYLKELAPSVAADESSSPVFSTPIQHPKHGSPTVTKSSLRSHPVPSKILKVFDLKQ